MPQAETFSLLPEVWYGELLCGFGDMGVGYVGRLAKYEEHG